MIGFLIAPFVAVVGLFVAWLFALVTWDLAMLWWHDPEGSAFRIFATGMFIWFVLCAAYFLAVALLDRLRRR